LVDVVDGKATHHIGKTIGDAQDVQDRTRIRYPAKESQGYCIRKEHQKQCTKRNDNQTMTFLHSYAFNEKTQRELSILLERKE
jgi:hypothetical protein